jgi:hypothetical protein
MTVIATETAPSNEVADTAIRVIVALRQYATEHPERAEVVATEIVRQAAAVTASLHERDVARVIDASAGGFAHARALVRPRASAPRMAPRRARGASRAPRRARANRPKPAAKAGSDDDPPAPGPSPHTLTVQNCAACTGFEPKTWKRKLVSLNVPHGKVSGRIVCLASDWIAAVSKAIGRVEETRESARDRLRMLIGGRR